MNLNLNAIGLFVFGGSVALASIAWLGGPESPAASAASSTEATTDLGGCTVAAPVAVREASPGLATVALT